MYIYPNLLPHEQFHKVLWLRVDDGPWWYYTPMDIIYTIEKSEEFFEYVDEEIRNLVRFLHGRGYATTPSCAGHFHEEDYFNGIYDTIRRQQDKIRNQEVSLTTANQESINPSYQDPSYYIPWGNEKKFIEEVTKYQTKGVLGIIDRDKKIYKAALTNNISTERDKDITLLYEPSTNKERKKEGWDRIGGVIVDAIA